MPQRRTKSGKEVADIWGGGGSEQLPDLKVPRRRTLALLVKVGWRKYKVLGS
jgi:hypothetical protein